MVTRYDRVKKLRRSVTFYAHDLNIFSQEFLQSSICLHSWNLSSNFSVGAGLGRPGEKWTFSGDTLSEGR